MSPRLSFALNGGGLVLPDTGTIAVFHPSGDDDLSVLPTDRVILIQPVRPDHEALAALGFQCVPEVEGAAGPFAAALIYLPRAKAQARGLIAAAAALTDGPLLIDGQKTDGIDSLLREVRKRASVSGAIAKAHGKLFWLESNAADWSDWAVTPAQVLVPTQQFPVCFRRMALTRPRLCWLIICPSSSANVLLTSARAGGISLPRFWTVKVLGWCIWLRPTARH